jgi:CRISPR-associated protein Cmr5
MPKLKDQDRAVAADRAVRAYLGGLGKEDKRTEYRQELQQLPSRILASGLGQTLAFYASKAGTKSPETSGDIHAIIGGDVARFLTQGKKTTTVELLNEIMAGDTGHYRRRTREALAYAEWLKRYAAALIERKK